MAPAVKSPDSGSKARDPDLEAKIARIQARNKALEKRHQEVEADRIVAEKQRSSVTNNEAKPRSPFSKDRGFEKSRSPRTEGDLGGKPSTTSARESVHSRLGKRNVPPPDPGYSFLADKVRDGSNGVKSRLGKRGDEDKTLSVSPRLPRLNGRSDRTKSNSYNAPKTTRGALRERNAPTEEDANKSPPRFHLKGRLERVRQITTPSSNPKGGDGGKTEKNVVEAIKSTRDWECADPGCLFYNQGGSENCAQCGLAWSTATKLSSRRVQENGKKGLTVNVDLAKPKVRTTTAEQMHHKSRNNNPVKPHQNAGEWMEMPEQNYGSFSTSQQGDKAVSEESEVAPTSWQQTDQPTWSPLSPLLDWSEEVANEMPSPSITLPQNDWGHSSFLDSCQMGMIPHQEYIPVHDPALYIPPLHPQADYLVTQMQQQQQQQPLPRQMHQSQQQPLDHYANAGGSLTHLTHAPIMTSAPLAFGQAQQQYYHHQHHQPIYDYQPRRYDYFNREPRSRIPERFHKQRPSAVQFESADIFQLPSDLPYTKNSKKPESCRRLTMFVNAELVIESDISQDLKIPVKVVDVSSIRALYDSIDKVCPETDAFVLIHVGSIEALEISMRNRKDVEKGTDSDKVADGICEIVEDLVKRIPFVTVFISMLPPRYDRPEQNGMCLPNSVRRVMNVQISTRLHDMENVILINNDDSLGWGKDEDKRDKVMKIDGKSFTAFGICEMVTNWLSQIRPHTISTCQDSSLIDAAASDVASKLKIENSTQDSTSKNDEVAEVEKKAKDKKDDEAVDALPTSEIVEEKKSIVQKGNDTQDETVAIAEKIVEDAQASVVEEVHVKPVGAKVEEGNNATDEKGDIVNFSESSTISEEKLLDGKENYEVTEAESSQDEFLEAREEHDDDDDDVPEELTTSNSTTDIVEKENEEKMEKDFD